MLETWLKVQESNAESLANDQQVREVAAQILAATQPPLDEAEAAAAGKPPSIAALNARLGQELGPGMSSHDFVSYFLADKQSRYWHLPTSN